MITCSWKETFGIECFFCGFQRSIYALLEGDLLQSFIYFPALLPFIFTISFATFHILKHVKNGHKVILTSFIITVTLMLTNFAVKLFIH